MKQELIDRVAAIVGNLFANGNTPSKVYGIDSDNIERVEQENPHVCKQYPWQADQKHVA